MAELPAFFVTEPHALLQQVSLRAWRSLGVEPITEIAEIDSSAFVHDEAELLDADELATAEAALLEDGIFADPGWIDAYTSGGEFAETDREALLRAATKYGWALAHLAQAIPAHPTQPIVWSLERGATATTLIEFRFLTLELRRRGIALRALAPCWPVTLQPATDLQDERDEILARAVSEFAPFASSGPCDLFVRNAMDKFSALPQIAESLGTRVVLGVAGMGALEAARLVARVDPALFRELLASAQERFPFDKGREELFTTEDDVHALPDVPDADLERVFLEDTRGRQLLHVTSASSLGAPELGPALERTWQAAAAELDALVVARAEQHLAVCHPCRAT